MKVRAEKSELNRKEKEVVRAQQNLVASERAAKIQSDYDALSIPKEEILEEEEPLPTPKKARKPARRIIVHEVSSASDTEDDTVDVILPKQRRGPSPEELVYRQTLNKMFTY